MRVKAQAVAWFKRFHLAQKGGELGFVGQPSSGSSMSAAVGDIDFPMVVHLRDADTAKAFPRDGTSVWPRTSRTASR